MKKVLRFIGIVVLVIAGLQFFSQFMRSINKETYSYEETREAEKYYGDVNRIIEVEWKGVVNEFRTCTMKIWDIANIENEKQFRRFTSDVKKCFNDVIEILPWIKKKIQNLWLPNKYSVLYDAAINYIDGLKESIIITSSQVDIAEKYWFVKNDKEMKQMHEEMNKIREELKNKSLSTDFKRNMTKSIFRNNYFNKK